MNTVQQVFALDPNECTEEDLQVLIEAYRSRRSQFLLGNQQAGSIKKTAKEEAALSLLKKGDDLLKDLGLT